MKKIFRYIVLLIVVYLVVQIFVYFLTKPYYKDMNNYKILVENPKLEIIESKANKKKGYIRGIATNNTSQMLENIKLKFDFYNDFGRYVGSQYYKVDLFNINEKSRFEINYKYENVSEIKISIISE